MKWVDTLFAWALVLLGAAHSLAAYIPALHVLRGPWSGAAAICIVSAGLMNAVRSRRVSDRFLGLSTAVATLMTTILCMNVLWNMRGNVLHQPAALSTGILLAIELIIAVLG